MGFRNLKPTGKVEKTRDFLNESQIYDNPSSHFVLTKNYLWHPLNCIHFKVFTSIVAEKRVTYLDIFSLFGSRPFLAPSNALHCHFMRAFRGSFFNYVDQFLPIIVHLPTPSWHWWRILFTVILRKIWISLTFPEPPATYLSTLPFQRS